MIGALGQMMQFVHFPSALIIITINFQASSRVKLKKTSGTAGRIELASNKEDVWELMIPVSPKFQAKCGHGLGMIGLPVTELETGKRLVDARQAGGVAQVIVGVRMRRHELVEEFLVNVGRALRLAGLGEMSPPGAHNRLGLVVAVNPFRGIIL